MVMYILIWFQHNFWLTQPNLLFETWNKRYKSIVFNNIEIKLINCTIMLNNCWLLSKDIYHCFIFWKHKKKQTIQQTNIHTKFKGYQKRASASRKRDTSVQTAESNSTHKKTSKDKFWHNSMNLFSKPNNTRALIYVIINIRKQKNTSINFHTIHISYLFALRVQSCCHCYCCG